ncbi:hypothetical protein PCAR4_350106 [Paraburkholderia caribensis]|nr:hypothetical protein PCAR4_350106 [Paraburkholderia caribensis]
MMLTRYGAFGVAQIADIDAGDKLLMQGDLSLDCTLSVIEYARERVAAVIVNAAPWCWPDTSALELRGGDRQRGRNSRHLRH